MVAHDHDLALGRTAEEIAMHQSSRNAIAPSQLLNAAFSPAPIPFCPAGRYQASAFEHCKLCGMPVTASGREQIPGSRERVVPQDALYGINEYAFAVTTWAIEKEQHLLDNNSCKRVADDRWM
jgi:hypothetical protein